MPAGARHRRQRPTRESQRWRDRARSPVRHVGRASAPDGDARARADGQAVRTRDNVHRCGAGYGDGTGVFMTSTLTASSFDITGERPRRLLNYVAGEWVEGAGKFTALTHAVTGAPVAEAS